MIARQQSKDNPLRQLRLWVYAHPVPFDPELADLLSEAGCKGVSLSAEHICREDLAVWKPGRGPGWLGVHDRRRLAGHEAAVRSRDPDDDGTPSGGPGENLETLKRTIDESLQLPTTVVGYTLGVQVFPHAPLGVRFSEESAGEHVILGLQSNTARSPILLKRLDQCSSVTEYERQFMFDDDGRIRPVYYFSPELPEDPETITRPDRMWVKTIRWINDYVPKSEHYRVALPTVAGDGGDDNNYADNPFLKQATALGYKGAYYSWWRHRDRIAAEARLAGLTV